MWRPFLEFFRKKLRKHFVSSPKSSTFALAFEKTTVFPEALKKEFFDRFT